MVARWKPVHAGHAAVLEGLAERALELVIGIGSVNRHDARNPFSASETAEMLRAVLGPRRVTLLDVPDLGDGPRWAAMVERMFGSLDAFVTANGWVRDLMARRYTVLHPVAFVPPARRARLDGTMVRLAMARGEPLEPLVPPAVLAVLRARGWIDRFRRDFGAATLAARREDVFVG